MTQRIFFQLFGGAVFLVAVTVLSITRFGIVAGAAAGLLTGLCFAALFGRRLAANLSRLVNHAQELANGNFHARLEPTGRGAFGLLGSKLNETSANSSGPCSNSNPNMRNSKSWSASVKILSSTCRMNCARRLLPSRGTPKR